MANTEFKHVISAVELNTTVYGGIVRGGIQGGIRVGREPSSGEPYPRIQTVDELGVTANWESRAIASWLGAVGCYGKKISELAAGAKFYAAKAKHGGTRETGSNHIRYTIKDGIILPDRISVGHRQSGTISFRAVATYDGSNEVVVKTEDVALPAGITDTERFSLGPITLASGSYTGITQLDIDFGLREDALAAESAVRNTEVSISDVLPEITVRGINPKWFAAAAVPLTGLSLGQATTTIYLRRKKDAGTYYGDGESQHVALNVAGLAYLETIFDARGNDTGETALRIAASYDGSNDILKFQTGQTIA